MNLEIMKNKAELARVYAAKSEMEYRIATLHDEIKRLAEHVAKQNETELTLKEKLKELGA